MSLYSAENLYVEPFVYVSVVEDIDKARHDDEDGPPAFEVDVDQVEEFQGPDDAEGQKGDAADDFACAIHCVLFCCIKVSRRYQNAKIRIFMEWGK